jgi:DNA-binding transcriptional regulator YiaG
MRKVEAVRLRHGISKTELAAKLETTTDALRAWIFDLSDPLQLGQPCAR